MKITLNGTPRDLAGPTVAEALAEAGFEPRRVATALNGSFLAQEARARTTLRDGDALEVLSPMQGG